MGENYVTRVEAQGSVSIAEDVIATIAYEAARSVDGVGGFSTSLGGKIADRLSERASVRGVKVFVEDNEVSIDLFFLVQYGAVILDVTKAVQETVASSMEAITGLRVKQVNVTVCGVAFEKGK